MAQDSLKFPNVEATLTAVPDGVLQDRPGRLRLSIAVIPTVDRSSNPIDLRNWPAEIAKKRELHVYAGQVTRSEDGRVIAQPGLVGTASPDIDSKLLEQSPTLWRSIFTPSGGDGGFVALHGALANRRTDAPQPEKKAARQELYGTYHTADLGRVIEALYASATVNALTQRAAAIVGAHERDVDPTTAWWKALGQQWFALDARRAGRDVRAAVRQEMQLASAVRRTSEEQTAVAVGRMRAGETSRYAESCAGDFGNGVANSGPSADESCRDDVGNGLEAAGAAVEAFEEFVAAEVERTAAMRADLAACADSLVGCAHSPGFWNGRSAAWDMPGARTLQDELARFEECWAFGQSQGPGERKIVDPNENAGRKFAAILSHPTVAKYLGLAVDVEIDAAALLKHAQAGKDGVHHFGAIAVDLSGNGIASGPHTLVWTTFVYRPRTDVDPGYFGPCPRAQSVKKSIDQQDALKDGLLDLTLRNGETPRFGLLSVDVTSAVVSLRQQAVDRTQPGELDEPRRLPELRARGITLVDSLRRTVDDAEAVFKQRRDTREEANATVHRIRDAEDLLRGYRIDVGVGKRAPALGGNAFPWNDRNRWRSLMCRDVTYGERHIPKAFQNAIQSVRDRNDGVVQPMAAVNHTGDSRIAVAHHDLFSWSGESLAVQALPKPRESDEDEEGRTVEPNPDLDLAIDVDFDLPKETPRRPAPLRHERGYLFGARACFVNGCGLSLPAAIARYVVESDAPVLGAAPRVPYIYRRIEEIQAPEVLLPWDDRVVTSPAATGSNQSPTLRDARGETIDNLVVRSGAVDTRLARRFVVPPRTTFELCEQSEEFDDDDSRLAGAFVGALKLRREPSGTFPMAGAVNGKNPDGTGSRRSRGSMLEIEAKTTTAKTPIPPEPYHVDPLANAMRARFVRNGVAAAGMDGPSEPIAFWPGKQSQNAMPVVLDIQSVAVSQKRGQFASDTIRVKPKQGPSTPPLPRLTVQLAPAEVVDLELWSAPDPARIARALASISNAIAAIDAGKDDVLKSAASLALEPQSAAKEFDGLMAHLRSNDPVRRETAVSTLLAVGPLPLVNTSKIVRLVHAVDRPIDPPAFAVTNNEAEAYAVVITVPSVDTSVDLAPNRELQAWEAYVKSQSNTPHASWPSQKGGATTFLFGKTVVHRASTGRLRCEARWNDYGPQSLRWVDKEGNPSEQEWRFDTPEQIALFPSIDEIDPDYDACALPLDLLRDDRGRLRGLFHSFPDGRARHLRLKLIGTSRFTEYYEPATAGRYEKTSTGDDVTLWVGATERPAPPVIDRVLPVFHLSPTFDRRGREVSFTRETSMRLFLRAPWHTSGEEEKLAVLFWRESVKGTGVVTDDCAFDAEGVRPFRDLLTRWGADPIHVSASPGQLIQPSQFADPESTEKKPSPVPAANLELTLPAPPGAEKAIAPIRVDILAYDPRLTHTDGTPFRSDDETGPWICDVKIDPKAVYYPFVQLGLARYQQHAVAGLELSTPVAAWCQVPPVRKGTISYEKDRWIVLTVHGVGFHNPSGDADTVRPLLNVQMLIATRPNRLPRDSDGTRAWRRAVERGALIERLELPPDVVKPAKSGEPDECWWIVRMQMPRSRPGVRYGLLIEEIERMRVDRMREPVEKFPLNERFYEDSIPRSPLFSHIVDLGE
jgi:hypothetical protein